MNTRLLSVGVALLIAFFGGSHATAQLTGTITVPNATYPTFAGVISALNAQGVGAGGVVINLTASQTAPAGGYNLGSATLNASTSATNTITINGGGNTLTASAGTSTTLDGIFTIAGTDYVTINSLNLAESASNTTTTTRMEWGYGLLKLSATDGCNHVTIQSCTVTLNKLNTTTEGLKIDNHTPASTTLLTITTASGVSSNNSFIGNTIQNVNTGVVINGYAAASPYTLYGQNNRVVGNTIQNFASTTTAYGIYIIYQNDAVVYNNVLNNMAGGGVAASSTFYGIYHATSNDANSTIRKNTLDITHSGTSTIYLVYNTASGDSVKVDSNLVKLDRTGASGASYVYYVTGAARYCNVNANVIDSTSLAGSGAAYLFYVSAAVQANGVLNINDNKVINYERAASGSTYGIYQTGAVAASSPINLKGNKFSDITTGTGLLYPIYAYNSSSPYSVRTYQNDTVQNVTMTSGTFYGMYAYNMSAGSDFSHNRFESITTGGTHYTMYLSSSTITGLDVHDNVFSDITSTSTSASMYNMYLSGGTDVAFYRNRFTDIESGITTAAAVYPLYISTGTDVAVYNNAISDIRAPAGATISPVYGMYFNGGTDVSVYHNTINLNPTSTGTTFGATGVYYSSAITNFDFRNNIVRVNAVPVGTGFTVALRRSAGTAGTAPANLNPASNGNIYWVPTATNAWLYGEGLTAAAMVNTYNLTNDPSFNTPCGLYKIFMSPRENASFSENNLVQTGAATGVFAPSGTSFAQNNGVPTTSPAVTTDFYNVTRGALPDAGAVEFSGTANDAAGPAISYTALPTPNFCLAPPTLAATITDATGVNTTAGTAPRLYYKKSTEANAFGGANNSSTNGWKWVEATGTAPNFSFTPDYSLLTSAVVAGDVIQYFVVAQDNAATPNVSSLIAAYPAGYCPSSVALPAAAGPLATTPAPYSYTIGSPASFTASASPADICVSGDVTLSLNAPASGLTVQWQSATLAGAFSNISGATTAPYTLTGVSATARYRAIISCGASVVATTNEDTVAVQSPAVLSVTPPAASQCGGGTFTMSATGSAGTNLNWYAAATGGAPLGSGSSFTTPFISSTTTYYVGATTGSGSSGTVGPANPAAVGTAGGAITVVYYMQFTVLQSTTLLSVDIYPSSPIGTSNSINIYAGSTGSGVPLFTIPYTTTVTSTTGTAVQTITLNVPLTPGTYSMGSANTGISLYRNTSGATYPYTSSAINITGNTFTSGTPYYYYFYNWQFSSGCESPRTAVTATVTPPATATATATGSTAICQGSSVVLNASPTGAGFNYQWLLNGAAIPGATSASYTATQAGNYTVSVYTTLVCNDTSNTPVVVSVAPVPTSVTPTGPVTLCTGGSQIITGPSGTGLSYQWLLNNAIIPSATSQTYSANATGNYRVRVTTSGGCSDTSQPVAINVVAQPASTISPSAPAPICANVGVVLSGPVNSSYTYQWYLNGNPIANATGQTYNAMTAGQYTLRTQVGTGSTACSTFSSPVVVTTTPLPPTAFTVTNSGNICAGSTVTLTGPVDQGYSYQWLLSNSPVAGANGQTYTTSVAGSYRLRVTALATGCTDTSAATVLTARPLPAATTSPSGSNAICYNATQVLSANAGTGLTYQWLFNTQPVAGATGSTYTANATGQYAVRVTSQFGCVNTSAPYTLTVRAQPPGQISYTDPLQFCAGGAVVLTAAGGVPGYNYTYQWFRNGVQIPGTNSPFYQAMLAGVYTLRAADSAGCQALSPGVTVVVNPAPTVTISASGPTLSASPAFYQQYQWFHNNQAIAGATGPTYTVTPPGAYRVEAVDNNGCLGQSTSLYMTTTGISDAGASGKPILVYPNPASSILRIDAPIAVTATFRNGLGQTVLVERAATQLDIARFPDGLYTLTLTDADGAVVLQEKISKVAR